MTAPKRPAPKRPASKCHRAQTAAPRSHVPCSTDVRCNQTRYKQQKQLKETDFPILLPRYYCSVLWYYFIIANILLMHSYYYGDAKHMIDGNYCCDYCNSLFIWQCFPNLTIQDHERTEWSSLVRNNRGRESIGTRSRLHGSPFQNEGPITAKLSYCIVVVSCDREQPDYQTERRDLQLDNNDTGMHSSIIMVM